MKEELTEYYEEEKKYILEKCKECGLCAKKCPILKHTELKNLSPKAIQKELNRYLQTGEKSDTVYTRVFSCMECFKCVDQCCPEGLNPLLINEIIKWLYRKNNILEMPYTDPFDENAEQRVLASIQVSGDDYKKILTPTNADKAKYVFFPGCNVYAQPEKILSALDIMNLITDDFAFVPGLNFCCGNVHYFSGVLEKGAKASYRLIDKIASYEPESVIFWCPTCHCRFVKTLAAVKEIPFKMISFPQFIAANMDRLPFKKRIPKTATLHEACKSAFTRIDVTGPQEVLNGIPEVKLHEMPRHGTNTVCCGSGAVTFFPQSFESIRDERLMEASQTKADILIDICHFCHQVFATEEPKYNYTVKNYVTLLAEALDIEREDKFKKYIQWKDIDRIIEDAEIFIESSPYSRERIHQVLKATFLC